jgi:hypothetical protein
LARERLPAIHAEVWGKQTFRLSVHGELGTRLQLWISNDLRHWEPIMEVVGQRGGVHIPLHPEGSEGTSNTLFFRVTSLE